MTLLRVLLFCLAISLAGCTGGSPFAALTAPTAPVNDPLSARLEQASLDLVNAARRGEGLEPMRIDPVLSRTARAHAHDMQARGYYGHNAPSGAGVQQRHDRGGGAQWRLVAENIARCSRCTEPPSADDVRAYHERWMASSGHRRNILSSGFDSFGFGVAHGEDGFYLVQNFSGPGMPSGLQPGDSLSPLSPEAQATAALDRINAARSRAGAPPLALSPDLSRAIRQAMPRPGAAHFDASRSDVQRALSAAEREQWRSIGTVYGACGGCGRAPVAADIRFFVSDWLERPGLRSLLLDPAATDLAFALAANGEGRKIALAALGRGR